jgi:hypothetical protein
MCDFNSSEWVALLLLFILLIIALVVFFSSVPFSLLLNVFF